MPLLLKSQPHCSCFAVLPVMRLIQAMGATVSTELRAIILQYVHHSIVSVTAFLRHAVLEEVSLFISSSYIACHYFKHLTES